jgi:hypothetical protein
MDEPRMTRIFADETPAALLMGSPFLIRVDLSNPRYFDGTSQR